MADKKQGEGQKREEKYVEVDSKNGVPVRMDGEGHLAQRIGRQGYSGESGQVYKDKAGNLYVGEGENRKKLTQVPAYVDDNGILYADTPSHNIVLGMGDGGLYQVISNKEKKQHHEGRESGDEKGLGARTSLAIAMGGLLIGLMGLSPAITGNVVGTGSGVNVPAAVIFAIGLLGIVGYFYFKRR